MNQNELRKKKKKRDIEQIGKEANTAIDNYKITNYKFIYNQIVDFFNRFFYNLFFLSQ